MGSGQPHGSRLPDKAVGGRAREVVVSEDKYKGVSQK